MEVYTFPDAGSNGSVSGPCSPPTVLIRERDEGPIIQKKGMLARFRSGRAVHKGGLQAQLRAGMPDQRVLITKGRGNGMGIE